MRIMQNDVFDVKPSVSLAGIEREEGPALGAGKLQRFLLPDGRVFAAIPARGNRWNVSDSTFNVSRKIGFVLVRKIRGKDIWVTIVVESQPPGHAMFSRALSYIYPMEIRAADYFAGTATFDSRMGALMCGIACLARGVHEIGHQPIVKNDLYPEEGAA